MSDFNGFRAVYRKRRLAELTRMVEVRPWRLWTRDERRAWMREVEVLA